MSALSDLLVSLEDVLEYVDAMQRMKAALPLCRQDRVLPRGSQ